MQNASVNLSEPSLSRLWNGGYTIAELWAFTAPVDRETSCVISPHGLMWGILRIAEDQIDVGAGHRYLRQRIFSGDWIGIGHQQGPSDDQQLVVVPRIDEAKFGRTNSSVGDGQTTYTNVRFVHRDFFKRHVGHARAV